MNTDTGLINSFVKLIKLAEKHIFELDYSDGARGAVPLESRGQKRRKDTQTSGPNKSLEILIFFLKSNLLLCYLVLF